MDGRTARGGGGLRCGSWEVAEANVSGAKKFNAKRAITLGSHDWLHLLVTPTERTQNLHESKKGLFTPGFSFLLSGRTLARALALSVQRCRRTPVPATSAKHRRSAAKIPQIPPEKQAKHGSPTPLFIAIGNSQPPSLLGAYFVPLSRPPVLCLLTPPKREDRNLALEIAIRLERVERQARAGNLPTTQLQKGSWPEKGGMGDSHRTSGRSTH